MKRIALVLVLLLPGVGVAADGDAAHEGSFDPNHPASLRAGTVEELLVELAWKNHPANRVYEHRIAAATARAGERSRSWTDEVRFFGGLYNGNVDQPGNDGFWDSTDFNFGIGISLGAFVNNGARSRQARQEVEIAEAQEEAQRILVRQQVLTRWHTYQNLVEVLKVQAHTAEDAHAAYLAGKKRFEEGDLSPDGLHLALAVYNRAREEELKAQSAMLEARFALEATINMDMQALEELLRTRALAQAEAQR